TPSSPLFPYTTLFRSSGPITLGNHDLRVLGGGSALTLSGIAGNTITSTSTGNLLINANGTAAITIGTGAVNMVGTITNSGTGARSEEHTSELQSRSDL